MEAWEHPDARVDQLILMASKEEVEAGNIDGALASLQKLLNPANARKFRGRLIFGIRGYDDDPRDLWEIEDIRSWMQKIDREFPYWFYFMDTGPSSTLSFIAFSLCQYEKVSGGKVIPTEELQRFLLSHFVAMNDLSRKIGETQEETDARSKEIAVFFS